MPNNGNNGNRERRISSREQTSISIERKNENIRDSFIRFPIVNPFDQSRQMLICHGNLSSSRNLRGRGNFYEGIELPVLTCHHAGNKSPRLYTSFAAVVVVVVVVVVVHRETRDSIILARVYVLTFRAWAKGKFDEKTEKL